MDTWEDTDKQKGRCLARPDMPPKKVDIFVAIEFTSHRQYITGISPSR